jgi:hypothetical protein
MSFDCNHLKYWSPTTFLKPNHINVLLLVCSLHDLNVLRHHWEFSVLWVAHDSFTLVTVLSLISWWEDWSAITWYLRWQPSHTTMLSIHNHSNILTLQTLSCAFYKVICHWKD